MELKKNDEYIILVYYPTYYNKFLTMSHHN